MSLTELRRAGGFRYTELKSALATCIKRGTAISALRMIDLLRKIRLTARQKFALFQLANTGATRQLMLGHSERSRSYAVVAQFLILAI